MSEKELKELENALVRFYRERDIWDQIPKAPTIAARYVNNQPELWRKLLDKYKSSSPANEEPSIPLLPPTPISPSTPLLAPTLAPISLEPYPSSDSVFPAPRPTPRPRPRNQGTRNQRQANEDKICHLLLLFILWLGVGIVAIVQLPPASFGLFFYYYRVLRACLLTVIILHFVLFLFMCIPMKVPDDTSITSDRTVTDVVHMLVKWPFISFIFFAAISGYIIYYNMDDMDISSWNNNVWYAIAMLVGSLAYSTVACCYTPTYFPSDAVINLPVIHV